MFVKNHYPRKKSSAPVPRSRWLAGMVAGQLLGFAVAVAVVAPIVPVAILVSTLAGGALGVIAAVGLKSKPPAVMPIPVYEFQPLAHRPSNLNEKELEEDFKGAAVRGGGGEKDRFARKAELALKPPTPPAPPKFGGM